MRKGTAVLVLVLALMLSVVLPASAHVHGITPLNSCSVDNPLSGGDRLNTTRALSLNGGPISGLIPRDVGEAPLDIGDGGMYAPVRCP
jgi:hypothetical protein